MRVTNLVFSFFDKKEACGIACLTHSRKASYGAYCQTLVFAISGWLEALGSLPKVVENRSCKVVGCSVENWLSIGWLAPVLVLDLGKAGSPASFAVFSGNIWGMELAGDFQTIFARFCERLPGSEKQSVTCLSQGTGVWVEGVR